MTLYSGFDKPSVGNGTLLRRRKIKTENSTVPGVVANVVTIGIATPVMIAMGDVSVLLVASGALAAANASWVGRRLVKKNPKAYQKNLISKFSDYELLEDSLNESAYAARRVGGDVDHKTETILRKNSNEISIRNVKELVPVKTNKALSAWNPAKKQTVLISSMPVRKVSGGTCYKHSSWEYCVKKCHPPARELSRYLIPSEEFASDYYLNSYLVVEDSGVFLEEVSEPSEKGLWLKAYDKAIALHNVKLCQKDAPRQEEKEPMTLLEYGAQELQFGATKALEAISTFLFGR